MKKPNFFILGAPKCGTTSLSRWIGEHPQVFFSHKKEPHYFNDDGLKATKTIKEYEKLFSRATSDHLAVGEGSTHYLFSKTAVPNILQYSPDSKFIVCLRNPVEMAPALHAERVWQGRENITDFEEAWRIQDERKQGKHIPLSMKIDPERLQYGAYCRLGEQLNRLYRLIDKDRVLTVLLDDLKINPRKEYTRIIEFIGVQDDDRHTFPVFNSSKITRSVFLAQVLKTVTNIKKSFGFRQSWKLHSILISKNTIHARRNSLNPCLINEMQSYFYEDIQIIELLLNRDLSGWLKEENGLQMKHSPPSVNTNISSYHQ